MCEGCLLSYETDRDYVLDALAKQGMSNIRFIESREGSGMDVHVLYFESEHRQWVFFRGTEGYKTKEGKPNWRGWLRDWLQNFKIKRQRWIPAEKGLVHRGFLQEVLSVSTELIGIIKDCPKPVRIGGHSKGGALAALLSLCLGGSEFDSTVDEVFTFGSPRVLDYGLARRYNALLGQQTFRAFHSNDIVPRTPFALRFKHVGVPVYVREDAGFFVNPDMADVLYARFLSYKGDFGEDHDLRGYYDSIRNYEGV